MNNKQFAVGSLQLVIYNKQLAVGSFSWQFQLAVSVGSLQLAVYGKQ